jgi:hypothetical protein
VRDLQSSTARLAAFPIWEIGRNWQNPFLCEVSIQAGSDPRVFKMDGEWQTELLVLKERSGQLRSIFRSVVPKWGI